MKSRLHLYPHSGPKTRAYIVAEPAALRELARLAEHAARSATGIEFTTLFGSDGHEYELVLVSDVTEQEWQTLPLPADKNSKPDQLRMVQIFDELKTEISSTTG